MSPIALLVLSWVVWAPAAEPAAAVAEAPRERVLVLDVRAPSAELSRGFTELVVSLVSEQTTLDVMSSAALRDRVELEGARQAMADCDQASCLAELAGAIGARWLVVTRYARVVDTSVLTMELYDAGKVDPVTRQSIRAKEDSEITTALPALVAAVLRKGQLPLHDDAAAPSSSGPAVAAPSSGGGPPGVLWWGLGLGVAGVSAQVAWMATLGWALDAEVKHNEAIADYRALPDADNRAALRDAYDDVDNASTVNNCVMAPLGCTGAGVALTGLILTSWGLIEWATSNPDEESAGGAP